MGALDERLPRSAASLRRAAWAGLQDSMPRAALLSLHARVERIDPSAWEDRALAQLWGPRFSVYVVARRDFAIFSLGRYPETASGRARAEQAASALQSALGDARMLDREVGTMLKINPNALKYATTTGTVAIRWAGARAPEVWMVEPPQIEAAEARRELARRHLRVFGPTTAERFARWAGIKPPAAAAAYASLERELLPVLTPLGGEWLLESDAADMLAAPREPAPARLLPSGDAFYLLQGPERELLVPRADHRARLWTSRVWPGAVLVDGEVRGTWRRDAHTLRIEAWGRLAAAARDAVEAEARLLPLPLPLERAIEPAWVR